MKLARINSQLSTQSGWKVAHAFPRHSQLGVDVVGEVEELLLAVGLSCRVSREETLRSFTAARLPEPLRAEPEHRKQSSDGVIVENFCFLLKQVFVV